MEIKSVCNTILVGLMCVSSPTQAVGTGRSELASAMGIKGGGGGGGQGKFFGRSDLSFGHHSVHVRVLLLGFLYFLLTFSPIVQEAGWAVKLGLGAVF